jgi:hypothetical protein
MVNNFDNIKDFLRMKGLPEKADKKKAEDLYFTVEIVKRAKDHKEIGSNNYHFKNYYITSIDRLDALKDEIITLCDTFGMRAYISVNRKSFKKVALDTVAEMCRLMSNDDFRRPYRVYESCSGKYLENSDKTWIVDLDADDLVNIEWYKTKLVELRPDGDTIIYELPTNSGVHLITKPFNRDKFYELCDASGVNLPDIKLNHLTALYANV